MEAQSLVYMLAGVCLGLSITTIVLNTFGERALLPLSVVLLLLAIAVPAKSHAADAKPLNVLECAALAGEYSADPFALQVGQLDALRLCVADHMALIQRERDDAREGRAIQRNFGKLEDAE